MNHVVNKKQGFTLIELMLAMSFISVLLIAVALTVIQISGIYNRGITLKDVNQAGRSISAEMTRSVGESPAFSIEPGAGSRFVQQDWGGRLCVGQYSYIWNYGKAIVKNDITELNSYDPDIDFVKAKEVIRFIKVLDPSSAYCQTPDKKVNPNDAIELLNVGEHNLAIHKFTVNTEPTATDAKTKQQLYSINFILGTNDQDALTYDSGLDATCKPPSTAGSDLNYCAVNLFDLTVRAGNAVK
ncbi:MAG TPA: type II secretion system protein [Candidatus Saccharibacteria bacterium]|nr:type II secretion system protein [Candidatus Saccharibacteria bacterium]